MTLGNSHLASRPAALSVSEPGSFAEHTIVARKPEIIARVIATNNYPPEIVQGLGAFEQEIASGRVGPLLLDAPDTDAWMAQWERRRDLTWRQLDWFFAEAYFYRRLLEIVGYFSQGPWQAVDPFAPQKREALAQGLGPLAHYCAAIASCPTTTDAVMHWLDRCLWGNQVDLSNITVEIDHGESHSAEERLLVDHRSRVAEMMADGLSEVHWVADNSGTELLADLAMAEFLLTTGLTRRVVFHLKGRPFFVSDAMVADAQETIMALCASTSESLKQVGTALQRHLASGRLTMADHPFWTTWEHHSALPDNLRAYLAKADLILVKGDANYRRLLEDRHWPTTASMADLTSYMPASFVSLRTLKSEIVVGLAEGQAQSVAALDSDWLVDGRWGIVHLVSI